MSDPDCGPEQFVGIVALHRSVRSRLVTFGNVDQPSDAIHCPMQREARNSSDARAAPILSSSLAVSWSQAARAKARFRDHRTVVWSRPPKCLPMTVVECAVRRRDKSMASWRGNTISRTRLRPTRTPAGSLCALSTAAWMSAIRTLMAPTRQAARFRTSLRC